MLLVMFGVSLVLMFSGLHWRVLRRSGRRWHRIGHSCGEHSGDGKREKDRGKEKKFFHREAGDVNVVVELQHQSKAAHAVD